MGSSDWFLRPVPDEDRRRYVEQGWWAPESLGQRLARQMEAYRHLPFVIHSASRPWRTTFGDVLDMSLRVASGLNRLGVSTGDVVSFQTPNWIEGAATFYGAALLGAVVAPIVHIYGSRELGYILGQCAPRVHVTAARFGHQDYLANLEAVADPPAEVVVVGGCGPAAARSFQDLLDAPRLEAPVEADPSAPALVGWTSGTTANAKGVVHSHQTVGAEVTQLGATSPPQRPILMANPISHAIGMLGALLVPVDRGRPIHLLDAWDPAVVLDLMVAEDLTAGGGAPYFLTSLLEHPSFSDEHLARLPYQGMGGAPVPRAVAERAAGLGITIYRMYGSTEQPSITGCTFEDPLEKRLATDGRPLPGNRIRVVGADGSEARPGQPGEIWARGPDCFLGYTDAALTRAAFDDEGWYHTGDIGVRDADGYLCITDRISDVIIRGGENVSAAEVEEAMLGVPGVAEVAVVAAPDERLGEHAAAFVRMLPGASPPSLTSVRGVLQRAGLARQKWPEEIVAVDDFPRTASGKVQKYVLRRRVRDQDAASGTQRNRGQ